MSQGGKHPHLPFILQTFHPELEENKMPFKKVHNSQQAHILRVPQKPHKYNCYRSLDLAVQSAASYIYSKMDRSKQYINRLHRAHFEKQVAAAE